jgi:hypothetical protein
MTIVGTYEGLGETVTRDALQGECVGATHVVNGMAVGAFEFYAGAAGRVGAGADAVVAGGGARSETKRTTLNRGGDRAACDGATGEDEQPPYGCGALLRVEVARIAPAAPPSPPPAPVAPMDQPDDGSTEPTPPAAVTAEPPDDAVSSRAPAVDPAGRADSGDGTGAGLAATSAPPLPPPAAPDQGDDSGKVWAIVAASALGAAVVAGVIIGAVVKANEDDEDQYEPQPGNLGEETLVLQLPVIRW